MNAQRKREVADWVQRSRDDRRGADLVVPHGLYDLACFLAQQSAEKALKGLLCAFGERPEKTHELESLIARLQVHGVDFGDLLADAELLTPMAVLVRYPGFGHMTLQAAQEALDASQRVCDAVTGELAKFG